ncbi:MAG: carbohydrate-binding protein, partial [Bacteroidetes bacterium]|nr:carbohydrate-binding protein [Bacteroidota bacterium]
TTWNNGGSYRNDGVDIQPCSDIQTNGYNVGWIETGEFLKFTVDVEKDGNYAVSVRVAANDNGGIIGLSVDNNAQILTTVTKTGGWQNWETQTLANVNLTQGTHTLRFSFYFGGFNVNYFESVYNGVISSVENNTAPVNDFSLFQNFPNPFNPATTITYSLPRTTSSGEREERMKATLTVYNILGKEIAVFVNKEQAAGLYTVSLNTGEWSGGVYFYTLQYGALRKTMRMLLVK